MDPEKFKLIRRTSQQFIFRFGETIIKQGSKATHSVFLHSGIVKFNFENEIGKNLILEIVSGPKLLGGANLFFRETNLFSLVAIEDCKACLINARAFKKVLSTNAPYAMRLFQDATELFKDSIFNYISLAQKQVYGRIADVMLYLWEKVYQRSENGFTLMRKDIAEFAACSPENVATILTKLSKEGVIKLKGKSIVITNLEKLHLLSRIG
jgi:CRP-like cAMP-binding protein